MGCSSTNRLIAPAAEITALNARLAVMQPVGDKAKALIKEIDAGSKLLQKAQEALVAMGDRQIEAQTSEAVAKRVTAEVRKIAAEGKKLLAAVAEARVALTGDPAVQLVVTGSLKRFRYFEGQAHWLLSRFPGGVLRDVQGLVKLVDHAELAANDYSLTPGRYVGVAPEVENDEFDFEEALREIHLELDGLNLDAAELAEMLGITGLGSGGLALHASITPADNAIDLSVAGNLGEFEIDAAGQMPSLAEARHASIEAQVQGPNFGRIARLAGNVN